MGCIRFSSLQMQSRSIQTGSRRSIRKRAWKREYRGGYSLIHGHYSVYKLTLTLDSRILHLVCFLFHSGSPHDSVLYEEIMQELKRCRIMRIGNITGYREIILSQMNKGSNNKNLN